MKILFIYDFPLWGSGSGVYLRNLIKELVRANHKIGLIAPEGRRFLGGKIKQYRVKPPQIPVFVGHPELKGAKRYSELSEREITKIYKSYLDTSLEAVINFEPDLIHVSHLSLISWVARYIKAMKNIRYIITSHGSCLSHILEDKRYLPLSEDALNASRAITVVSGNTRSRILRNFGRKLDKNLKIVPGGVDMSLFPKNVDTSHVEKKFKLKNKEVVLFCGRLSSEKGAKYLVKAAKDIKGDVYIIGGGPQEEYLSRIIKRKKLENVHLLGYLPHEELVDFYYRADVFVAPSVVEEALGLSILEAMAAKTPVVATRKGGIPTLVKSKENGLFVRVRNSSQIAQKCNKLLEDNKLRQKMSKKARETIEKKFTWKRTAKKMQSLYKRILGNGK